MEKKKNSKKKFLTFGLLGLFAIALVAATPYLVNSFTIKSDVYEPFQVQYAIIGDAGNWDGETNCNSVGLSWFSAEDGFELDVRGLYAGESRVVCSNIKNLGEGDVAYTLKGEITNTNEEVRAKCLEAFGEVTKTGTALKLSDTKEGVVVNVAGNAPVVDDCKVKISVLRG